MAHKVHQKIYRIRGLEDWDSRWFNRKNLPKYLEEDFVIREFLLKKLKNSAVEKIEIERFPGKVIIIITSARPGLIIGRGGAGIEELKKGINKVLLRRNLISQKDLASRELKIELKESKNIWASASLVAQWASQQLEKRLPHRRVMKQALEKVMANKEVQGARIEVSGRLEGAEIARREWLQKGRLPRITLRSDIDYALEQAHIPQGVLGVKVWIYKGEKI